MPRDRMPAFALHELVGADRPDGGEWELAGTVAVARALESAAAAGAIDPRPEFRQRLLGAIAAERPPNRRWASGASLQGRPREIVSALIALLHGRLPGGAAPLVRAQVLGVALLIVLSVTALAAGAGAIHALRLSGESPLRSPAMTGGPPRTAEPTASLETMPPASVRPIVAPPARALTRTDPPQASPRATPRATPHSTRTPGPADPPEPTSGDGSDPSGGDAIAIDGPAATADAAGTTGDPVTSDDGP